MLQIIGLDKITLTLCLRVFGCFSSMSADGCNWSSGEEDVELRIGVGGNSADVIKSRRGCRVRRRIGEVLRVLCDMSFWRSFIAVDMREEACMMHKYE